MKILLTGFDPFAGDTINPAYEALKGLPDSINGVTLIKEEIPTVFHESADLLKEKIEEVNPDVIVCIGQAGGRVSVTPERVAINVDDARIADNKGNQPTDKKIQEDGPAGYFSTLPIKAMVEKMQENHIPARISNSAGTFVCNHVMYQALYMVDHFYPNKKAGFIHVPFIPEQVAKKPNHASMHLSDITKALEACIEAIIERHGKEDIEKIGGTTH